MVPRLPSLDTGPVTGAPSLVAVLRLLQGLEGREGIFLPSCFLSFQDGQKWGDLVLGGRLQSCPLPWSPERLCVLRWTLCMVSRGWCCVLAWELEAGARCGWGVCLHVGGKPSCFLELLCSLPQPFLIHVSLNPALMAWSLVHQLPCSFLLTKLPNHPPHHGDCGILWNPHVHQAPGT